MDQQPNKIWQMTQRQLEDLLVRLVEADRDIDRTEPFFTETDPRQLVAEFLAKEPK